MEAFHAPNDKSEEKVLNAIEDVQNEPQETEEHDSKRFKLCTPDIKAVVNIKFSVSDVKSNYRDDGLYDSSKIAAFDFDGCLANTDVKRVGENAWSLMHSSIPDKLQSLYNDGYKLVIFTNESNIERWKNKRQVAVDSKIGRLNNFIEKVKVPVQVYIACGVGSKSGKADKKEDDPFRKPKPGMWHLMEQHFNSGIAIDMDQSFYVGDAAGRESDHSDADIKFAERHLLKPMCEVEEPSSATSTLTYASSGFWQTTCRYPFVDRIMETDIHLGWKPLNLERHDGTIDPDATWMPS
ncbi:hypothetical protein JHK85_016561 [Glycine max]|nr:hypothetical protein JHK85_016561 [Glycine max]